MASLSVGQDVVVRGVPERGKLVFLGQTEFKPGVEWAGVVYSKPVGRNNGTVQGKAYFECEPNHGLFAPSSSVEPAPAQEAEGDAPIEPAMARRVSAGEDRPLPAPAPDHPISFSLAFLSLFAFMACALSARRPWSATTK